MEEGWMSLCKADVTAASIERGGAAEKVKWKGGTEEGWGKYSMVIIIHVSQEGLSSSHADMNL